MNRDHEQRPQAAVLFPSICLVYSAIPILYCNVIYNLRIWQPHLPLPDACYLGYDIYISPYCIQYKNSIYTFCWHIKYCILNFGKIFKKRY